MYYTGKDLEIIIDLEIFDWNNSKFFILNQELVEQILLSVLPMMLQSLRNQCPNMLKRIWLAHSQQQGK